MARKNTRSRKSRLTDSARRNPPLDAPDVFQEMLADADLASPSAVSEEGRPVKKRRVGGKLVTTALSKSFHTSEAPLSDAGLDHKAGGCVTSEVVPSQQTIYDDSAESSESEADWEDVDLGAGANRDGEESTDEAGDLTLTLGGTDEDSRKRGSSKRKPITAAQRKLRLEIHKMHTMSLLSHVHLRNHWCNDEAVQTQLKGILSKRTYAYLDDQETLSQFQRTRSLTDGIEQAIESFRDAFEITTRGLQRCYWAEDADKLSEVQIPEDVDLPVTKADFRKIAKTRKASRDIGAQLFCAMLRFAGLETRLVCSLQPLPFSAAMKGTTPVKPKPAFSIVYPETRTGMNESGPGSEIRRSDNESGDVSENKPVNVKAIRSRIAARMGPPPPATAQASRPVTLTPKGPSKYMYTKNLAQAFSSS